MNREVVPLIVAILVPLFFVSAVLLFFYGYDITSYFKKIDAIYYVIVLPFGLGLFAAVLKWKKE